MTIQGLIAAVPAYGDVLPRLGLDLVAIVALVYGLFYPRHKRMDLVVVYALFNVGLFVALLVIAGGELSMGVGFGLFAVLSIVRLRSEPFSNRELAYFFVALVLALVCAIDLGSLAYAAMLAAVALVAAWAIDHPRLSKPTRRLEVTLELVFADDEALRRHLEERLNAEIRELSVLEIDYVRETTRVEVRYIPAPRTDSISKEALDATVAGPGR
jgi:Domain of unknown function (DUF4956)